MRKWTLRADDELADGFARFCTVNGVSIQSMLEAMVRGAVMLHEIQGSLPTVRWESSDHPDSAAVVIDRWVRMVEAARYADAEKRQKRKPPPSYIP